MCGDDDDFLPHVRCRTCRGRNDVGFFGFKGEDVFRFELHRLLQLGHPIMGRRRFFTWIMSQGSATILRPLKRPSLKSRRRSSLRAEDRTAQLRRQPSPPPATARPSPTTAASSRCRRHRGRLSNLRSLKPLQSTALISPVYRSSIVDVFTPHVSTMLPLIISLVRGPCSSRKRGVPNSSKPIR